MKTFQQMFFFYSHLKIRLNIIHQYIIISSMISARFWLSVLAILAEYDFKREEKKFKVNEIESN